MALLLIRSVRTVGEGSGQAGIRQSSLVSGSHREFRSLKGGAASRTGARDYPVQSPPRESSECERR
jgi:hypothetical protein